MADAFLLDTSAFITLTDREPGVERVRDLLHRARRREADLHGCFVTLTEMQYILTYATLIHKDPEFAPLAGQVRQEMLPPKTPAVPGTGGS